MGSIAILCFYFLFFFIENLWACRERATCNGLAVGFACRGLLGLDRLVLFFFFFGLKVEQITDNFFFFFNLMVLLIFD